MIRNLQYSVRENVLSTLVKRVRKTIEDCCNGELGHGRAIGLNLKQQTNSQSEGSMDGRLLRRDIKGPCWTGLTGLISGSLRVGHYEWRIRTLILSWWGVSWWGILSQLTLAEFLLKLDSARRDTESQGPSQLRRRLSDALLEVGYRWAPSWGIYSQPASSLHFLTSETAGLPLRNLYPTRNRINGRSLSLTLRA